MKEPKVIIIPEIQYVDGLPSEGQRRIRWIENGEHLNGAEKRFGNDGELNRASVEIQDNVKSLNYGVQELTKNANESNADIAKLFEIVSNGTGEDINARVLTLETEVIDINTRAAELNSVVVINKNEISALKENVGVYDPMDDTYHRTLREDDVFLKREIGNYTGEDINAQPDQGAESSGIKGRIETLITETSSNKNRITAVEEKISISGVETIAADIALIREELGASSAMQDKPPVFDRLNSIETAQAEHNTEIVNIQSIIDVNNNIPLHSRVSTNETDIRTVSTKVSGPNGLESKIADINSKIGAPGQANTIIGDIEYLDADIENLNREVGVNDASGLRKKVIDADAKADASVLKANQVEAGLISTNSNVSNLQIEIGDSNSGLKSSVLSLSTKMNGTVGPSGTTVDEKGVYEVSKLNFTAVQGIQSEIATLDASFGTLTIRVNGIDTKATNADTKATTATQDVVALRGRVEAAETKVTALDTKVNGFDARITTSTNKLAVLEPKVETNTTDIVGLKASVALLIPEAPKDGQPYVRIDGQWKLLSGFVDLKA